MRDRIVCENGLRWFEPKHNLEYKCDDLSNLEGTPGDGFCDEDLNISPCFDGGDCCQSTCVPSDLHECENEESICLDKRASDYHPFHCFQPEFSLCLFALV